MYRKQCAEVNSFFFSSLFFLFLVSCFKLVMSCQRENRNAQYLHKYKFSQCFPHNFFRLVIRLLRVLFLFGGVFFVYFWSWTKSLILFGQTFIRATWNNGYNRNINNQMKAIDPFFLFIMYWQFFLFSWQFDKVPYRCCKINK